MTKTRTAIDIHADVLCPWCYIGHRRLQAALTGLPESARPDIGWRAFELSPDLSRIPGATAAEQMAAGSWWGEDANARIARIRAIGAAEGLELNLHLAKPVNSFDAHRLMKLAAACDRTDATMAALMRGYHTEGLNIADRAVLEGAGLTAGLNRKDIRSTLAGDAFGADVRADERLARRRGVTSVPSLVIDDRTPINGVLSPAELLQLLTTTADRVEPDPRRGTPWT